MQGRDVAASQLVESPLIAPKERTDLQALLNPSALEQRQLRAQEVPDGHLYLARYAPGESRK